MPHSTVCKVELVSLADPMSRQHGLDVPCILAVVVLGVAGGMDIAGDYTENQLEILS